MKMLLLTCLVLVAVPGLAGALDLESHAPAKPAAHQAAPPIDPALIRQGGDTIETAAAIVLPYSGTGTTVGYNDDYDEVCPYDDSTAPDVVYTFTPAEAVTVEVDMLGSLYDTKIYIYDADLNLVACNDDFYPDYVSKLENVPLVGGTTYYLVIDGYGTAAGEYSVAIDEFEPCVLDIPAEAVTEGEPEPEYGYEDCYNNGCSGECDTNFEDDLQPLLGDAAGELVFHGRSGWYESAGGGTYRDTDWFIAIMGPSGQLEVTIDAVFATFLFELGPQDCAEVAVVQNVPGGPCTPATMIIVADPGSAVWLWTGPTTFEGPVDGYDYLLTLTGLQPGPVASEAHSWSSVKSMFR